MSTKIMNADLWETIKGVQLNIFSLPNQTIESFLTPVNVEPSKLYLEYVKDKIVPPCIISFMEDKLGHSYTISQESKYIVVSKS